MTQININFLPDGFPRSSETFIVGGTVRDILIGKTPSDVDIATTGDPEALAGRIASICHSRVVRLGKPGMTLFRVKISDKIYDIVPVSGGRIETDLRQRDFTVNAMAVRADDGTLIDVCDGLRDIDQKIIRMVSRKNLTADPIRLLRAYRTGAALNFVIDPLTRETIKKESYRITSAARERIRDELIKLLSAPSSCDFVKDMSETGMLTAILPEMAPLQDCLQNKHHAVDAFRHSLDALSWIEYILAHPFQFLPDINDAMAPMNDSQNMPLLKFTILIHDTGKPLTRSFDKKGDAHFYAHEEISAQISGIITRRLRFSNQDRRYVHEVIAHHMKPLFLFLAHRAGRLTTRAINRFFQKCHERLMDIFIHAMADMAAKGAHPDTDAFIEFSKKIISLYHQQFKPVLLEKPLINGDDLIREFGLAPSPLLGKILNHVEDQRLQDLIHNRQEALDWVRNFMKSNHRA
jgi:tRNA nucleotidyltransferase/poly(A) polymerase